ncbi:multiple cyclophane-containing RiPP AmcA [Melissospora conviva]|uniref:multiple cyclophane-containing RiPP AmcA n=1 Tax=Melissospora conviva TaxID=3388432 RepID=UPI003C24A58C
MTVYVSRYAATGELPRDLTDRAQPVERPVADLPLLTHVWRVVFEQQARKCDRR